MQIIPLTSQPNQTLTTTLTVNNQNITVKLFLSYNEAAGYWVMTVYNSQDTPLVASLPLVTGQYPASNLLEQYEYLEIGKWYVVKTSSVEDDYPNADNLGTDFILAVVG